MMKIENGKFTFIKEYEIVNFTSPEEMFETICDDGADLYNPKLEKYMFLYNDRNSICVYDIDHHEAISLAVDCSKNTDPWYSLLGEGGYIYDDPHNSLYKEGRQTNIDICKDLFKRCPNGWLDVTNYEETREIKTEENYNGIIQENEKAIFMKGEEYETEID